MSGSVLGFREVLYFVWGTYDRKCKISLDLGKFSMGWCRWDWSDFQQVPNPKPLNPTPATCHQQNRTCAAIFGKLYCKCCVTFLHCRHHFHTKSCAATNEKLHCTIEKDALRESGAFLPLCCGFRLPSSGFHVQVLLKWCFRGFPSRGCKL